MEAWRVCSLSHRKGMRVRGFLNKNERPALLHRGKRDEPGILRHLHLKRAKRFMIVGTETMPRHGSDA